ncbi:hypothetical protein [Streptomyces sp. OR43]|uniref:hypothetical protein n=1 Tax=Streptomyces sp. or43 TaxID=2478957 RepID=UPI00165113DA|nr:hypothetical protein [Streptomyces sp. or43]
MSDEAWLARFAALLRGRNGLSSRIARQHTADAPGVLSITLDSSGDRRVTFNQG